MAVVTTGGPLGGKILYKSEMHIPVSHMLDDFDDETLFCIASTASNKKVLPTTKSEAIDTILLYTTDIDSLFSYKKITSRLLSLYLYKNGKNVHNVSKLRLISCMQDFWKEKFSEKLNSVIQREQSRIESKLQSDNSSISESLVQSEGEVSVRRNVVKSDIFAKNFVSWFYNCINSILTSNCCFDSSMFCDNACADVYLITPQEEHSFNSVNGKESEQILLEVVKNNQLSFNPNIESGIQAIKSSYGLITVLSCGSLHHNNSFVGIFEQEFGLCQNPLDKCWKILVTKLNLKQAVQQIPQLPPSEIFELEAGP